MRLMRVRRFGASTITVNETLMEDHDSLPKVLDWKLTLMLPIAAILKDRLRLIRWLVAHETPVTDFSVTSSRMLLLAAASTDVDLVLQLHRAGGRQETAESLARYAHQFGNAALSNALLAESVRQQPQSQTRLSSRAPRLGP